MTDKQYHHPFAWIGAGAALLTIVVSIITIVTKCYEIWPSPSPNVNSAPTMKSLPLRSRDQFTIVGNWTVSDARANARITSIYLSEDNRY